jgi:hypothetical protein
MRKYSFLVILTALAATTIYELNGRSGQTRGSGYGGGGRGHSGSYRELASQSKLKQWYNYFSRSHTSRQQQNIVLLKQKQKFDVEQYKQVQPQQERASLGGRGAFGGSHQTSHTRPSKLRQWSSKSTEPTWYR